MDVRRINDVLKIAGAALGAVSGAILALVPFLSGRPLSIASAVVAVLSALGCSFASGLGTRAWGTEYQDIADAKARASTMPPPSPASAPNINTLPQPPR
jgi:hypothetical protein